MQKSNKSIDKYSYVICPYCKKKLRLDELQENGYIDKIANVSIITCDKCYGEFQE